MTAPITVHVNGEPHSAAPGTTLLTLLGEAGVGPDRRGVAVAVGDHVVRRADWASHVLEDGDRVEVVTATQGG